jgi:two-component system cell cycle response regulator
LESELRATAAALRFQADHDGLTQLLHRSAVMGGLEREFLRARRTHLELSIVLGDIDHFKGINDTYGHGEGDRVITSVASAIRDSIRPYDLAGRYGGEEFLIVLPGCSEIAAAEKADRLRHVIQERNEDQTTVTMSFGVCDLRGEINTVQDLLCAADSLLYTAKRAGRNRVESRITNLNDQALETNQRLAVV